MIDRAQLETIRRQLVAQAEQQYEQWTLTRGAVQFCEYLLALPEEGGAVEAVPPSEPINGGEEIHDSVSSD